LPPGVVRGRTGPLPGPPCRGVARCSPWSARAEPGSVASDHPPRCPHAVSCGELTGRLRRRTLKEFQLSFTSGGTMTDNDVATRGTTDEAPLRDRLAADPAYGA